jgi:hypothetical protein
MRSRAIGALALALCLAVPARATAQESSGDGASLGKIKPRGGGGSPLMVTGTVLAGLGGATIMASGICWLVAAAEASRLDDECPNKVCVEGSSGERSLETARDAKSASIVLFAIGLPVTSAGLVLLLYTDPRDRRKTLRLSPSVGPERAGADFQFRF